MTDTVLNPYESFQCFVDIYVNNGKMFEFEVKQNWIKPKEKVNFEKRKAICNKCVINGRKLPMDFQFTVILKSFSTINYLLF